MKLILILLVIISSPAILFADNELPQNYPGKSIIGKGYNVFGEFANNKSIQPYPLFDFSKMTKSHSQGYEVPRRVFLKEVNEHIVETVEGHSVNEYISNLSTDVGLDIDAFVFQSSFEDHFSEVTEHKNGVFYYTYMDLNTKWQISLDSRNLDTLKNYLDAQFEHDLANMDPESLFAEYGTHFITSAYLGGRIDFSSSTYTTEASKITEVKTAIKGKYETLSGEVSTENSYDNTLEKLKTSTHLSVVGGASEFTRDINSHDQYVSWATSLNNNPALCGFDRKSLKPIWLLCKSDIRANELESFFNDIVLPKHPLPIFFKKDPILDNDEIIQKYAVQLNGFKILHDCDYPTLFNSDGSGEFKFWFGVYLDGELKGSLASPKGKVYKVNSGEMLNINERIEFQLNLQQNTEIKVKYWLKEIGTVDDQVLGDSEVLIKQPFSHEQLCNYEEKGFHYTAYRLTHTSNVCEAEIYFQIAPIAEQKSYDFGNKGWEYFKSGEYDKCLEYSKLAIEENPGLWYAQYNVALVYLIQENPMAFEKYKLITNHCNDPKTIKGAYQDILKYEKKNGKIKGSEQIKLLLKSMF